MKIDELQVVNFRNHAKSKWIFGSKVIIVGENGAGKTNILEACYFLAIGKSKRAGTESEMIRYGEQVAVVKGKTDQTELQIILNDGSMGVGKKKFEVNGVPRRMIDFAGKIRMVEFSPSDLDLITGSPSLRRKYLDFVLSQADREYHRCLISYEKGLRARNRILENIREGFATRQQLFFWDKLLIKNGEFITTKREEYLNKLNTPSISPPSLGGGRKEGYLVEYDKSVISEARLAQYETEEVAAAATLVGPHRDDFTVNMTNNAPLHPPPKNTPLLHLSPNLGERVYRDVSRFGSRGEQRMAVLWLKLGERDFLASDNELPVLLFDDIFSELDEKHKKEVLKLVDDQIQRGGQVVMTTADKNVIPSSKDWKIIKL